MVDKKYLLENLYSIIQLPLCDILELVEFDEANRTSFVDEEENSENGYSKKDHSILLSRMKKYYKAFKENGFVWELDSPLKLSYVTETDSLIVLDGQGRLRMLEKAMHENEIKKDHTIPTLVCQYETLSEARDAMKRINTNNCNWRPSDVIRANAVNQGGDSIKIQFLLNEIKDKLKVSNEFIPNLILLGDCGRKKDNIPTSLENINPFYARELEYFEKIFNYFENRESTSKVLLRRIKSVNIGIALHSLFINLMVETYEDDALYYRLEKKLLTTMFRDFNKSSDDVILRIFQTNKTDCKREIALFIARKLKANKHFNEIVNRMK